MRTRSLFPLLALCMLFALCALLALGALPSAGLFGPALFPLAANPVFAGSPTWTDLQGPRGGSAQALALNPQFPADPTVFAGGGREFSSATWQGLGIFGSHDGGLTWPDRSGPHGGTVLDLAFSPDWQHDGFAAAALFEGVWLTADRGATWTKAPATEGSGPVYVQTVAASLPADGLHTVLAADPYGGIHRSPDDGATWTYDTTPGTVRRVRFSPLTAGLALAAGSGIWRSTDGGATWAQVFASSALGQDVAFGGDGVTAYATLDNGVWRSPDGGLTWQSLPAPPPEGFGPLGVSADGAALFTAAKGALYRFDLTAGAFVTLTTDLPPGAILRLEPSPHFGEDQTLLAGTLDGVFVSRDGGSTFTRSAGFAPFRTTDIDGAPDAPAGGDLFLAGEYGIWKRAGGSWQPLNNGMVGGRAYIVTDLAVSPAYTEDSTLFAAENRLLGIGGFLFKSTDQGVTWREVNASAGIGGVVVSPDFAADGTAFAVAYNRIQRSTDRGESWADLPYWSDYQHSARLLAISPEFAHDHALYAVGSEIYYSHDAGNTWQTAAAGPPLNTWDPTPWWATLLAVSPSNKPYVVVERYDATPPYRRHSQIWTSADHGVTWQQLLHAPDLPVAGLAVGPHGGGGETIYLSVFDDDNGDNRPVGPDLLVSSDGGESWQNLGAIPQGPAAVIRPQAGAAEVYVGSVGVWRLAPGGAPLATPEPCEELLLNRSFEYDGAWRIPETAYPAGRLQDKHSEGYWSMRSGIVEPSANVRSFSDFSQDVNLPAGKTITLRFQRWPEAGEAPPTTAGDAGAPGVADGGALAAGPSLDEFYRLLGAEAGDLQYGMLMAPPGGEIRYLYRELLGGGGWRDATFDLTPLAGQTVRLQFGTYNDGAGERAVQYFDNFSVQACSGAGPTPTPGGAVWLPLVEGPPEGDEEGAGGPPPAP
jgi:photosystem II stability/assembly factor-like uncharacterized protein